jgi:ABC-type dipeptide/oligopeptide/nickel transport system permease component
MLGLLLVYFIGKYFYQLAFEHNRSAWGYAILGVVVYYSTAILAGTAIAYTYQEFVDETIEGGTELLLSILTIPFGILGAYILYKKLEKNWSNSNHDSMNSDILDQGMS